jgi:hypothetical protein
MGWARIETAETKTRIIPNEGLAYKSAGGLVTSSSKFAGRYDLRIDVRRIDELLLISGS